MELLEFFAAHRNGFLDVLSTIGKNCGEEIVLLGIVSVLFWCVNKKLAYKIAFAYFYSAFFAQGLKLIFRIPRPWILNPRLKPMESALETATGYSFPSAHSQTVASLYGTIACNVKKLWKRLLCVIAIILTAWSRMYAGVHTPWDVTVGLLIGFICMIICHIWISPLVSEEKPAGIVCLVLGLFSVIGFVLAMIFYYRGIIDYANGKDFLSVTGSCLAFAIVYYLDTTRWHLTIRGSKIALVCKVLIGIATTFALKEGLKPVLSVLDFAASYIRYFVIAIWALGIYPVIFDKILSMSKGKAGT